ncbi:hypothetical protein SYNTR_2286 [Candidatus Syntrophocurvum alkaliphilum]|uniref:Diadenylate cyclase n=1 Tax=Candidatus Syntrophocurvum alkaliphilum TaxID=2293317 RepID=A0A6I6DME1_9FIRM|nr:diadenylate cyclase CdaA [Candidatus Syntrophocurvum alkaliphilum]QGU00880.1 hypothetical protein SYNTR_2286 [Candidatus Syntrophocurvum alkaliphilum]
MDLTILSGVFASPWNIIRALIDISIVSYVLYRILLLIKGTRAEQLLKGLIILLVFSVVASFLNLDMVNWFVEKLWIVFAITIPIVFQPELRRILEQIGRGKFFSTQSKFIQIEGYQKIVNEITDAVTVLSRNRVGALIVITREAELDEYLDSGFDIDATVSAGLLVNIFVPNTPLHDGAAVINKGRLEKAACFLPLSDNPYLDKELGTRHRAGLGISEVSDAISIIVSEETGAISLAKDGQLNRYLDKQSLKDMLGKDLIIREKWSETFRRRWSSDRKKQEKKHNGS